MKKVLVGAFNQEKALVGAFPVIANLRMYLRFNLYHPPPPNSHLPPIISASLPPGSWVST